MRDLLIVKRHQFQGGGLQCRSTIEAVVPRPWPRLAMSALPLCALTKVDAIQKPRPEPGTLAWRRGLRNDLRPR